MFTRFLLKNGPGSPGQTAKSLINHFNITNQIKMAEDPSTVYTSMLVDRMSISYKNKGNYYSRLYDIEKVMEFLEDDICTFTFLVLFSESNNFRETVRGNKNTFNTVTQVIYEVCDKNSALCTLSLYDFRVKADRICRLHIFHF